MYVKRSFSILLSVLMILFSLPIGAKALTAEDISAPSAILVEGDNFNILYEKNSHKKGQ